MSSVIHFKSAAVSLTYRVLDTVQTLAWNMLTFGSSPSFSKTQDMVLCNNTQSCFCRVIKSSLTDYKSTNFNLCDCSYILVTKLRRPRDSEGAFRSLSQVATCLPHTVKTSHCPFNC